MRLIRRILVRCVRVLGASLQATAWLVLTATMLTLFIVAAACILARLAFNVPMLVWRAASQPRQPHP